VIEVENETEGAAARRLRQLTGRSNANGPAVSNPGVRTGTRGAVRQRGDNGVSPPPPLHESAALLLETDTSLETDRPSHGITLPTTDKPRHGKPGITRTSPKKPRPAPALEWQEARVPLLGRLWAKASLPSTLLAGCVVALMYLLQTAGVATTGYDIQRLQVERDDWQLRNEQLRLELAKRRSLTWIEAEATGRLGMVRAEPTALTYLKISR
jgi:hypothetical protein